MTEAPHEGRPRARGPARCPYCHDALLAADIATARTCERCRAGHHADCWLELERCGSCGAEATTEEAPAPERAAAFAAAPGAMRCPGCARDVRQDEPAQYCLDCGAVHHWPCWSLHCRACRSTRLLFAASAHDPPSSESPSIAPLVVHALALLAAAALVSAALAYLRVPASPDDLLVFCLFAYVPLWLVGLVMLTNRQTATPAQIISAFVPVLCHIVGLAAYARDRGAAAARRASGK